MNYFDNIHLLLDHAEVLLYYTFYLVNEYLGTVWIQFWLLYLVSFYIAAYTF